MFPFKNGRKGIIKNAIVGNMLESGKVNIEVTVLEETETMYKVRMFINFIPCPSYEWVEKSKVELIKENGQTSKTENYGSNV